MKDPSRQRKDDDVRRDDETRKKNGHADAKRDGDMRAGNDANPDSAKSAKNEHLAYIALMVVLIAGTMVVIATLLLTGHQEDSFTQLYFNNHSLLPEYVRQGDTVPFSFTLNNFEKTNNTYDYTVQTDMYDLDYSCERPELWLESSGSVWVSKTNDPALYFKEDNYSIRFMYEIKSGDNIAVSIVDEKGKAKFTIILDYLDNRLLYNTSQGTAEELLDAQGGQGGIHGFNLMVSGSALKVSIDEDTYNLTSPEDISGYLQIKTKDTYAEFSDASITRKGVEVPLYIRLSESQYIESKLISRNKVYHADPVNLSNYTVRATFRILGADMMLALSDNISLTYENDTKTLLVEDSFSRKRYYVPFQRTINDLYAKVSGDSINVYYNDRYITTIVKDATIAPSISYDNVSVNDFYVKSDSSPVVINYILPESKERIVGLLTTNTLKYFTANETTPKLTNITQGMTEEGIQNLKSYIDSERITSGDYRLFVSYGDKMRSQNFTMALADVSGLIYMLSVDDLANTATFTHLDNAGSYSGNSSNVAIATTNTLVVDVENGTVSAYVNDKRIFNGPVRRSTNGTIFFDYTNITINSAKVDDRSTGKTIILKRQNTVECSPLLKKSDVQNGTVFIPAGSQRIIGSRAALNGAFDIAQVSVKVKGGSGEQEIHYWVKQI